MSDFAKLSVAGKDHEYPVLPGSVGPEVIDIRKLYAQTGTFTYDPGFTSTASCESGVTYIDGDQGMLLHRENAIGQLPEKFAFMSDSYLPRNRTLPQHAEPDTFTQQNGRAT